MVLDFKGLYKVEFRVGGIENGCFSRLEIVLCSCDLNCVQKDKQD